jgi:selenium-binding protein 1
VGREESDRDSGEARGSGEAAASVAGVQGRSTARHRHQSVSCWGSGEFIQYDVQDPFNPKKVSAISLGGMVGRAPHPASPGEPLNGGPQMVEISRDGRRVYFSNGLYTPWDNQFYPDGVRGWVAKVDVGPDGGMTLDQRFFLKTDGMRPHQLRLEGGDASSDSFCYA